MTGAKQGKTGTLEASNQTFIPALCIDLIFFVDPLDFRGGGKMKKTLRRLNHV